MYIIAFTRDPNCLVVTKDYVKSSVEKEQGFNHKPKFQNTL